MVKKGFRKLVEGMESHGKMCENKAFILKILITGLYVVKNIVDIPITF